MYFTFIGGYVHHLIYLKIYFKNIKFKITFAMHLKERKKTSE